jgi:dUTP pyrophosphatase
MSATGVLVNRTCYFAQPIDLATLSFDQMGGIESARQYLFISSAVVFSPAKAFQIGDGAEPTEYVQTVNDRALEEAELLVACFPEAGSIGVPMEIQRAAGLGIPTIVITHAANRSWALAGLDPDNTLLVTQLRSTHLEWAEDRIRARRTIEVVPTEPLLFKLDRPELRPTHGYADDAGFDLITSTETKIEPGTFADVPCGCAVELPAGVWGMITGRSSTLRRHQLLANTGIIDTGYRGQLFAGFWNLGEAPFVATVGMRLAQFIPLPNVAAEMRAVEVPELAPSARGVNGFGSTGIA